MADTPQPPGVARAGQLLRNLLTSRTAYRRRWQQHARRMRQAEVSYAGVSQVVALYLWDQGLKPDTDTDLPRRLRDRVSRALQGEQLTYETLTWITEAFDFNAADSHDVWCAFSGSGHPEDGITFTLSNPRVPIIKPQRHRTIALFQRYRIGTNRILYKQETSHVMVALEDGVDTYAHSARDTLIDMTVVAGGKIVAFHESAPGFVGVEFKLDQPLFKGQPTSLQYVSTHHPTSKPCTEVRRAARGRVDNIDLRVCFDQSRPRRAWWTVWDAHLDGTSVHSEEVDVTDVGELHRFVSFIEQTVVGFRWEW